MQKNLTVTRTGDTTTGKIPENVGFKMSASNQVIGLTDEQKIEQAKNISDWQTGKSKPHYTN